MLGRLRASWRLQPLLAVKDAKQTLQVAPLAAATSALGGPLATALPAAAPLRPAAAHARGWAAAAGEAEASAAAMASLAPCERGPEQQEANELDEQLSAAGRTRDPAAVLALINEALAGLEAGGSAFTELNTVTALAALADAAAAAGGSGGGGGVGPSPQDLVRSPACQALIGGKGWSLPRRPQLPVLWCLLLGPPHCCCPCPCPLQTWSLRACSASLRRCWRRQWPASAGWAPGAVGQP